MARKEFFREQGYESLASAIVWQAIEDMTRALVDIDSSKQATRTRAEYDIITCERFFNSQYIRLLTFVEPKAILKRIYADAEIRKMQKNKSVRINSKKVML